MENLRQQIEQDLYDSLESEWKIPVELTGPDGITQIYSKNNPDELLGGQVLYRTQIQNPETGEITVYNEPVLTLRLSSLNRVPVQGETWFLRMPISPVANAQKQSFVFTATRAHEGAVDIGFIRIYPQKIENNGSNPVS